MSKKKIVKQYVTPVENRVAELHSESISWLRKFFNVVIELFPLNSRDAVTPKSVVDFKIGQNKVDTAKPGINPSMSRVISPFKKIRQHLNTL